MRVFLYTFFAICLLVNVGCKKNVIEPAVDNSSYYFPIAVGYSWTYQMDSIEFNGVLSAPDTFSYWIKNTVVDTVSDVNGETTFLLERSIRLGTNEPYVFTRSFTETITIGYALRQDFNSTKVIHDFPVVKYKEWDVNQFNAGKEIDCYYTEVHTPQIIGGFTYDSTCSVLQDEADNAVQSFFELETYAKDVGLVYKEVEHLENIGTQHQKGVKYAFKLISFEQ